MGFVPLYIKNKQINKKEHTKQKFLGLFDEMFSLWRNIRAVLNPSTAVWSCSAGMLSQLEKMVCRGLGGREGGMGAVFWGGLWHKLARGTLALIACTVCTNTTKHSQTGLFSFLILLHENISITIPSDGDSGKVSLSLRYICK